jgi:hypothetical protein
MGLLIFVILFKPNGTTVFHFFNEIVGLFEAVGNSRKINFDFWLGT